MQSTKLNDEQRTEKIAALAEANQSVTEKFVSFDKIDSWGVSQGGGKCLAPKSAASQFVCRHGSQTSKYFESLAQIIRLTGAPMDALQHYGSFRLAAQYRIVFANNGTPNPHNNGQRKWKGIRTLCMRIDKPKRSNPCSARTSKGRMIKHATKKKLRQSQTARARTCYRGRGNQLRCLAK
jgi:hypothetical protein